MFILYWFLICIIFLLSFWIFVYYKRAFNYWRERDVPQLKPYFPLGNFKISAYRYSGFNIQDIYNSMKKTNVKYCGINILTVPIFMPLTPDLYREILIKNFNCFQDHGIFHDEEVDPMSAILVSLEGEQWRNVRKKLTPSFSATKIKMMFPLMEKCSRDISPILENSEILDIKDISARYTADIICSCAFGIDGNNLTNSKSEFLKYGRKLIALNLIDSIRMVCGVLTPQLLKKFKVAFFNPKVTQFFYRICIETIEYREKYNVQRNDFMDMLLKMKENDNNNDDEECLSVNQIAAQVFLFYFAGFETTAVTLSLCMYELARNTKIQRKVREEILNKIQENNGEINYDLLNDLKYTDQVIYETMRMYPPVTMLNRICTRTCQIPNSDLILDEGTRVIISVLGVHYDPEFYPEPEIFNPERFSNEEKSKRPSVTYFPFGEGPRICLGWKLAMIEMKLALCVFLKDYCYSVHPSTSKLHLINNGNLLGTKDKIWLKATKI